MAGIRTYLFISLFVYSSVSSAWPRGLAVQRRRASECASRLVDRVTGRIGRVTAEPIEGLPGFTWRRAYVENKPNMAVPFPTRVRGWSGQSSGGPRLNRLFVRPTGQIVLLDHAHADHPDLALLNLRTIIGDEGLLRPRPQHTGDYVAELPDGSRISFYAKDPNGGRLHDGTGHGPALRFVLDADGAAGLGSATLAALAQY